MEDQPVFWREYALAYRRVNNEVREEREKRRKRDSERKGRKR